MSWVYGRGFTKGYPFHKIFPAASLYVKNLKRLGYKDASSYLQRQEAKIWIDDILENIPVDFALPIHDSIIVKNEEAIKALEWCRARHPEIIFTTTNL